MERYLTNHEGELKKRFDTFTYMLYGWFKNIMEFSIKLAGCVLDEHTMTILIGGEKIKILDPVL